MIINPVNVTDAAGGTEIISANNSIKCKSIALYNEGANTAYLKYDGSDTAVTSANGIPLASGEKAIIDVAQGSFTNGVKGICAAGLNTTVRCHGIE